MSNERPQHAGPYIYQHRGSCGRRTPPLATSDHAVVRLTTAIFERSARMPRKLRVLVRPKPEHEVNECGSRLATHDWSQLDQIKNVNDKYLLFKETINDMYLDHFPQIPLTVYPNSKVWVTENVRQLMEQRDAAFRRKDKVTYLALRKKVAVAITLAKQQHYTKELASARTRDPRRWHRGTRELVGNRRTSPQHCAFDANILNQHFVSYGVQRTSDEVSYSKCDDDNIVEILDHEVARRLQAINLAKSQPINDCLAYMLSKFFAELAGPVAKIFNASLLQAQIPEEWLTVQVSPIPKTKSPRTPNDFRPIGLIPILMKVMEKYVADVLRQTKRQGTTGVQYGAQRGLSTTHYLVSLLEFVHMAVDAHMPVRLATIDVAKAFNSVNHQLMSERIDDQQLHPLMANWIKYFLFHMSQVVRVPGAKTTSGLLPVRAGVPQGTALAGELFVIYINDVPTTDPIWTFIDDLTTGAARETSIETSQALQLQINGIGEWLEQKKLSPNGSKSAALSIDFRKSPPTEDVPPLSLRGEDIPDKSALKILGVLIQNDLKFDQQVASMVAKSKTQLYFLRCLSATGVPTEDLRQVYVSYVRPVLEYAAPVWAPTITAQQDYQLELQQKRACALICRKWTQDYQENLEDLQLSTLRDRRDTLSLALAWKMYSNPKFRHLFPPTCAGRPGRAGASTRSADKLFCERYRTQRRSNSPIPYFVRLLNSSELDLSAFPTAT